MAQIDLTKYGITGTTEVVYNPSYEQLFAEETKPGLEGFEKGQETELGAVNVMTGVYTGRSPKDKFIVYDETSKDTGGLQMNIKTTTSLFQQSLGMLSRRLLRKSFQTKDCS